MSLTKSIKEVILRDTLTEGKQITIKIEEEISSQYNTFVWPCGLQLARYIFSWLMTSSTANENDAIFEIGAGCALPSLVFMKLSPSSHKFIVSDSRTVYSQFQEQFQRNLELNNLSGKVEVQCLAIDWGSGLKMVPKVDLVSNKKILLCSDCFYDSKGEFDFCLFV